MASVLTGRKVSPAPPGKFVVDTKQQTGTFSLTFRDIQSVAPGGRNVAQTGRVSIVEHAGSSAAVLSLPMVTIVRLR